VAISATPSPPSEGSHGHHPHQTQRQRHHVGQQQLQQQQLQEELYQQQQQQLIQLQDQQRRAQQQQLQLQQLQLLEQQRAQQRRTCDRIIAETTRDCLPSGTCSSSSSMRSVATIVLLVALSLFVNSNIVRTDTNQLVQVRSKAIRATFDLLEVGTQFEVQEENFRSESIALIYQKMSQEISIYNNFTRLSSPLLVTSFWDESYEVSFLH